MGEKERGEEARERERTRACETNNKQTLKSLVSKAPPPLLSQKEHLFGTIHAPCHHLEDHFPLSFSFIFFISSFFLFSYLLIEIISFCQLKRYVPIVKSRFCVFVCVIVSFLSPSFNIYPPRLMFELCIGRFFLWCFFFRLSHTSFVSVLTFAQLFPLFPYTHTFRNRFSLLFHFLHFKTNLQLWVA